MLSLRLLDTVVASLFLKIVSAALLVETKSNPTAEMLQPAHLTLNDESLEWVLPEILSANLSHDPRLTNCVWPYSRNGVCKAAALCELQGAADELTFEVLLPSPAGNNAKPEGDGQLLETQGGVEGPAAPHTSWVPELEEQWPGLHAEAKSLDSSHFMPYCHHESTCPHDAWKVLPLRLLGRDLPAMLELAPAAAAAVADLEASLPPGSLINAVLSMVTSHGLIAPHCDGFEGHIFARHAFVLVAPEPQSEIRVCSQKHTFQEGDLVKYNVSRPHEVINSAALPRIVLLFDVLHASVYEDANLTAAGLAHFRKIWGPTVEHFIPGYLEEVVHGDAASLMNYFSVNGNTEGYMEA